jgi:hypothetical protein
MTRLAMARRVTSGTGLPGDTGQYVAVSTVAWPLDEPRGLVKWRRSLRLVGKRRDAELLPPLFGTAKSRARYDRGTWQYWVVRLPLSVAPASIFGHELRHNTGLLVVVCLVAGIDMTLGDKRQPGSSTRQCAGGLTNSFKLRDRALGRLALEPVLAITLLSAVREGARLCESQSEAAPKGD